MKKLRIAAIAAAILLFAAAACRLTTVKFTPSYLSVIRDNWKISLPKDCRLIYQTDSGASFLGDGERYHIFQYDSNAAPNLPVSEGAVSPEDRKAIEEILSRIKVEKTREPAFDTITHVGVRKRNDTSSLYLCYSCQNKILYVIENFL